MADYTDTTSGGSGVGIYIGVAAIIGIILFLLFAGGGASTTTDPSLLVEEPPLGAPAADEAVPAAPVTE